MGNEDMFELCKVCFRMISKHEVFISLSGTYVGSACLYRILFKNFLGKIYEAFDTTMMKMFWWLFTMPLFG